MDTETLRWVADKAAIERIVYSYATGIDSKDWALWRSIYADEVSVLFRPIQDSGFQGSRGDVQEWTTMPADEWVSSCRVLFTGLRATQHTMSNPIIDIDGDEATCTMYMQATHFLPDETEPYTIGGYYVDQLVRTDEGWRIRSVNLNVSWHTGDPGLLLRGRARGAELVGGS